MDTSAFDVDAAGDFNLNLAELYHDLPEDVQNTVRLFNKTRGMVVDNYLQIDTILCLARSLTKVGLL